MVTVAIRGVTLFCLFLMPAYLFSQGGLNSRMGGMSHIGGELQPRLLPQGTGDKGQTDEASKMANQVPEHEKFYFSEQTALFFHEELPLPNSPPPSLIPPQIMKPCAVSCGDGGWRICFEFPLPVMYKEQGDACNLCLEFNQDISRVNWMEIEAALQFITQRFENNYNTLALGFARQVAYSTQSHGNVFILDIYPNYQCTTCIPYLLKLARARLLVEARLFAPAFCALQRLLCEHPGDRNVLFLLAELEDELPRWQNALHIYGNLRRRMPWDTVIQNSLHDTFYPHSSFVRFERQYIRYVHQAMEQIYKVSAEHILNQTPEQYTYIGGNVELHSGHISPDFVLNLDGTTSGFKGRRVQGDLFLRREFRSGRELTATAYATEGVVWGGGLSYAWLVPCIQGKMVLSADWRKPYWDTYETFARYGREDRVYGQIEGRYNRFFNYELNGGMHRVGTREVHNGWSSILVDWSVYWNFYVNTITNVSLHYDFDAEYVFHHATRIDAGGEEFQLVPLSTFEFHTLKFDFVRAYLRWLLTGGVGYTQNRLGAGGLNADIGLRYQKPFPCAWEAAILASQFPSTTNPGATEQVLTLEFTFRY